MTNYTSRIKAAREIGQNPRIAKSDECWYSKYFVRHFSIYISCAFAKLGIPANIVTVLLGMSGLTGSLCMVFHNIWWNLVGAVLWQFWFILDCVDGEVARLLNRTSILGIYLDELSHVVVNSTFVLAFGLHVYLLEPTILNLVASIGIYSLWHWKREIGRIMNSTLVVKGSFEKNTSIIRQKKPIIRIAITLCKIFGDVEVTFFLTAAIIASHKVGVAFARRCLYTYTCLLITYFGIVVFRHIIQISKAENAGIS